MMVADGSVQRPGCLARGGCAGGGFVFTSSRVGGYLAVDFFFVLSGFILSHGYLYGTGKLRLRCFWCTGWLACTLLHAYALVVLWR